MSNLPLSPEQALQLKKQDLPDYVLKAWNDLIVLSLDSLGRATIGNIAISAALAKAAGSDSLHVIQQKWLDVAGHFDRVGWDVSAPPENMFYHPEAEWVFKPKGWQHLMLDDGLMDDVRNGTKKVTIRKGRRMIYEGLLFLEATNSGDAIHVDVDKVMVKQFFDIPIRYIKMDGAGSHDEMLEAMRRFYPDMDYSTICTVIEWK